MENSYIRDWSRVMVGMTWNRRSEKWVGAGSGKEDLGVCSKHPGVSLEALEQGSDTAGMHTGRLEGS